MRIRAYSRSTPGAPEVEEKNIIVPAIATAGLFATVIFFGAVVGAIKIGDHYREIAHQNLPAEVRPYDKDGNGSLDSIEISNYLNRNK